MQKLTPATPERIVTCYTRITLSPDAKLFPLRLRV